MRDPFRTNAKQQFVREAQIGMTAVAIVLALFLYVAFHKITGRGRHLTDRVRNAPIAEPAWPRVNSGDNSARLPRAGLDVGAGQRAMNASNSRPTQGDRLSAPPSPKISNPISSSNNSENHLDSFNPLTPKPKHQAPEPVAAKTFSNSDTKPTSFEPGSLEANDLHATDSSLPQIDTFNADPVEEKNDIQLTSAESIEMELAPQNDFEPKGTIAKDDFPTSLHPGLPEPSVSGRGNGHAFADGSHAVSSDDSSTNDFEPAVGNNDSVPKDLPTSSAKSRGASDLAKADDTWPSDGQKLFPPSRSKSDWPTAELPTLRSPRPLPDEAAEQPQRFSGSIQEDIAKALLPDDSSTSIETRLQPTGTPANMIPPRPATYLVREGDSYWTISADVYNDGRFFRALYEHNRFVTPSFKLVPGTKLATPLKSDLIKLWPDHCPREESELTDEINGTSSDADRRIHVTQRGDTLFEIAGQKLGQASRYLEIYRLNQARLDSKVNHLSPLPAGVRLVLPPQ